MTLPTFHSSRMVSSLATSQQRYSSSSPKVSSLPQICSTESAEVYTIICPVAISSSASSSRISVPLALLLPMMVRPVLADSSSISSFGKPVSVKVWNGVVTCSPIISQCPVMVSLPALASFSFAKYARGFSTGSTPLRGCRFAIPSFCRFGMRNGSVFAAICPSVSVPASP